MKIIDILAFEDAQILAQMARRSNGVGSDSCWIAAMRSLAAAYGVDVRTWILTFTAELKRRNGV